MASIQSVSPTQVTSSDGVKLTIAGDGFNAATAVYFLVSSSSSKVFARSFTIVSDKQIDTLIPSLPITAGMFEVNVVIGGAAATVATSTNPLAAVFGPVNFIQISSGQAAKQ
ncbi:IPT/TIG domain-containing protein [Pandoraea sp. PE-S2R-1]|uniref:IPT/TIG domain-containing protein n=1 Tax=Pandoraea sp. PE-S2R-1 TaxID=1986994 RepID=UPI000B3F6AE2|nr:IPT/TIG domain-containing protein [Pandoraea sp. PE-S2R-1]